MEKEDDEFIEFVDYKMDDSVIANAVFSIEKSLNLLDDPSRRGQTNSYNAGIYIQAHCSPVVLSYIVEEGMVTEEQGVNLRDMLHSKDIADVKMAYIIIVNLIKEHGKGKGDTSGEV